MCTRPRASFNDDGAWVDFFWSHLLLVFCGALRPSEVGLRRCTKVALFAASPTQANYGQKQFCSAFHGGGCRTVASLGLASSTLFADGRVERTGLASLSREALRSGPRPLLDFGVIGGRLLHGRAG